MTVTAADEAQARAAAPCNCPYEVAPPHIHWETCPGYFWPGIAAALAELREARERAEAEKAKAWAENEALALADQTMLRQFQARAEGAETTVAVVTKKLAEIEAERDALRELAGRVLRLLPRGVQDFNGQEEWHRARKDAKKLGVV